jgi:hypothetical protein
LSLSSHDDETQVQLPSIEISTQNVDAPLQTMNSVDDIDEDEAFINELIAIHRTEDDIVVEDLESIDFNNLNASENNQAVSNDGDEDGVRNVYKKPQSGLIVVFSHHYRL